MIQAALAAAAAFVTPGSPIRAESIGEGAGHIHRSFRVECEHGAVVLQRLNESVFPDLDAVMANMARVTSHLRSKLADDADLDRRVLRLLATRGGPNLHRDGDGEGAWRCTHFIPDSRMPSEPSSLTDARSAARALGEFLRFVSDIPVGDLAIPIPGFHDTAARLKAFHSALEADPMNRAVAARAMAERALAHGALATALPSTPLRPVHNDTKLANVLLDAKTGEGLCVLDLDTVMPGLAAHDFGDLIRSAAFDGAEDDDHADLDLDRLKALAEGYREGAGDSLSKAERAALGLGARVITFELGLRFLTDHLMGDRYFSIQREGQNLARAKAQFARLEALEANADQLDAICAS